MPRDFHLLIGVPGSGKSTYAASLLALNPDWTYVCPDAIRFELTGSVEDQSRNTDIFLRLVPAAIIVASDQGRTILYDATNYRVKARSQICRLAKAEAYRVVAHVMQTPFDVCWTRNAARERMVPRHVHDRMVAGWDAPDMSREPYIDDVIQVPYIPEPVTL